MTRLPAGWTEQLTELMIAHSRVPAWPGQDGGDRDSREFAEPLLAKAGLPADLADALDHTSWDAEL